MSSHKDSYKNTLYLNSIKEDFLKHRLDVITIYDINKKIVLNTDSLFTGSRKDTFNTNLTKGIMNTRPYLYKNGLSSIPENRTRKNNLISDPEFRAVLWDRRMYAHDAEIWTPRIINSADSIIATIDRLWK